MTMQTSTSAASYTVRPSDSCPSGVATAVRMAPAKRVHMLYLQVHPDKPWVGKMPACGSGMGRAGSQIVLTDQPVTCPDCLAGRIL